MRAAAAFLLAVAAAVVVGVLLSRQPGYVLVSYGTTRVEFTLFAFVILYLAALLVGGGLWALAHGLGGTRGRLRRRGEARAVRRAERLFGAGLVALAEGRYAQARRGLEAAARGPLLLPALLAAARAAELGGDRDARDACLRRAYEARPRAAPAVLMLQADFELAAGHDERALATLKRLRAGRAAHPALLRTLARLHAALGEHGAVLDLLPELVRQQALPHDELVALAAAALAGALAAGDADPGHELRRVPRALRSAPALRRAAAQAWSRRGDGRRAAELLEPDGAAKPDPASVRAYAELAAVPAPARMRRLESWIDRWGEDPVLLREAGRVALELRLWGQARGYLERAARGPGAADPETALLRGRCAEQEGRQAEAIGAYRAALEAAARTPPADGA